jgi:hypothetical protein
MPTRKDGYRTTAGERVPSVTTVLSALGWKDGLIWWAWNEGKEGRDFRETKQTAADVGTLAHRMVECFIREIPFDGNGADQELLSPATRAFEEYKNWQEDSRAVVVANEVGMVSEEHGFGGTADALLLTKRGMAVGDWKSAKALYIESVLQIAAYLHLAEELIGERLEGGAHLFRFDKTGGGFTHKSIPREALAVPWRIFLRLIDVHNARKTLEALAK